jgi:hypothetical protein
VALTFYLTTAHGRRILLSTMFPARPKRTDRENFAIVAQLAEQQPFKLKVEGSSPSGRTTHGRNSAAECLFYTQDVSGSNPFARTPDRRRCADRAFAAVAQWSGSPASIRVVVGSNPSSRALLGQLSRVGAVFLR